MTIPDFNKSVDNFLLTKINIPKSNLVDQFKLQICLDPRFLIGITKTFDYITRLGDCIAKLINCSNWTTFKLRRSAITLTTAAFISERYDVALFITYWHKKYLCKLIDVIMKTLVAFSFIVLLFVLKRLLIVDLISWIKLFCKNIYLYSCITAFVMFLIPELWRLHGCAWHGVIAFSKKAIYTRISQKNIQKYTASF